MPPSSIAASPSANVHVPPAVVHPAGIVCRGTTRTARAVAGDRGVRIARIADAVAVAICVVRDHRAGVADVADRVGIVVGLVGIGFHRAVVHRVEHAVSVDVGRRGIDLGVRPCVDRRIGARTSTREAVIRRQALHARWAVVQPRVARDAWRDARRIAPDQQPQCPVRSHVLMVSRHAAVERGNRETNPTNAAPNLSSSVARGGVGELALARRTAPARAGSAPRAGSGTASRCKTRM